VIPVRYGLNFYILLRRENILISSPENNFSGTVLPVYQRTQNIMTKTDIDGGSCSQMAEKLI
jgi:hypothetical protein